jgi:DedD protein
MAEAPDINVDELRRRARRRLIGAIVLALGAAVIVPMLLESDPKPLGEGVSVRIPAEDNAKFVNRLSDKGTKSPATDATAKSESVKAPAKAESAAPTASPAPSEPTSSTTNVPAPKKSIAQAEQKVLGAPTKPAATVVPTSTPTPAPAPTPATAAIAVPAAMPAPSGNAVAPAKAEPTKDATKVAPKDGFSVQLAAFADDKGANALANKLKRAAYPAYTEPLNTSKGTLWRVRVGPYPSREAAVDVRDKLKGEGFSGIVAAAQ